MSFRGGIPDKARLRGSQIKSRDRVRVLAEVYTHEREVNAMLDLVPDMFPSEADPGNTDRTFLEPACGSGNFLVEILRRKLSYVTPRYGSDEEFEHRVLRCLASIYGIDISAENVRESRERMRALVISHVATRLTPGSASTGFLDAVETILETNVIQANTLTDAAEIELITYRPGDAGTFIREWSRPLDPTAGEPSLSFAPRCDEAPVHYSELARKTEPVGAGSLGREAA